MNTVLQAEDALFQGPLIATNHAGAEGSFVDYQNLSGDFIEWSFDAPVAGEYELSWRYALGVGNRPLALNINGAESNNNVAFSSTGGWSDWGNTTRTVNLQTGANTIRLTADGVSGANIDSLSISAIIDNPPPPPNPGGINLVLQAEDASFQGPTIATNHDGAQGSFVDFQNANDDFIEWSFTVPDAGDYELSWRYALGVGDRPLDLSVNGVTSNNDVSFGSTGSWSSWGNTDRTVTLQAGTNTIRLSANGVSGANIDSLTVSQAVDETQDSVLIFHGTTGFRHDSIDEGIDLINRLGQDNGWLVSQTQNYADINAANLGQYDAFIALNSIGASNDPAQVDAIANYVRNGGGLVGVHGGLLTFEGSDVFESLIGAEADTRNNRQNIHSANNTAVEINVNSHPATVNLPSSFVFEDEIFNYIAQPVGDYLFTVDEATYQGDNGVGGDNHPLAWVRTEGEGRVFYSALGHDEHLYEGNDPMDLLFQQQLEDGIQWVLTGQATEPESEPEPEPELTALINFQLAGAPIPDGYIADTGAAFSETRGYGWITEASLAGTAVPVDISNVARDRNASGTDQRLDTFLHMDHINGDAPAAAWEYVLPNGRYSVAVSVGDRYFDSTHRINIEGETVLPSFVSNSTHAFELATADVTVTDGKLTIDSMGGDNTRLNFVEIKSIDSGDHPLVYGGVPASRATNVNRNATVNATLLGTGNGVDPASITTETVQLYSTRDGMTVPGVVSTTGDGNAIVFQPNQALAANTHYTFRISDGLTDGAGVEFIPFSTTFTTSSELEPEPEPEPEFSAAINFQPAGAPIPEGYIADTGTAFSEMSGYGWITEASLAGTAVPVDISNVARDRNASGTDQRLDTFLHMEHIGGDAPAAAWEYALPNGRYSVAVSVGDRFFDSTHRINIEGETVLPNFVSNSTHSFELATADVTVTDGKLTIDSVGGDNTRLNFVEIKSIDSGEHPLIPGGVPASRAGDVNRDAAITLDVDLLGTGNVVDPASITAETVQLYRTRDGGTVTGVANTTGGGDAIVFQPSQTLDANTHYSFRISDGLTDEAGIEFLPFSTTFTTGSSDNTNSTINFNQSTVYTGSGPVGFTTLEISPDGSQLYGTTLNAEIHRWDIGADGSLSNQQVFTELAEANRSIIGLVIDPDEPNTLWITNNFTSFTTTAPDFSSRISKVLIDDSHGSSSGTLNATVEDYVVGLPRASRSHMSNSLEFGPDGSLYLIQGGNAATGAPDNNWGNRPERLLTASVLRINPDLTAPAGGFDVQTESYNGTTGNYDPTATGAPVTIFGKGIRNAYDLVWHSNGSLYVPNNGNGAAEGNTPDDPSTPLNEALLGVNTQNDYLYRVEEGGYYGHPNPTQGHYILNGGNPTAVVDVAEVTQYPVGVQPDPLYQGFAYDFGRNRSPNGVIEYRSDVFGGALQNHLLVVEYSAGDDILALELDANGQVIGSSTIAGGFNNPLDLVEHPATGNLYVSEFGANQISLLTVA